MSEARRPCDGNSTTGKNRHAKAKYFALLVAKTILTAIGYGQISQAEINVGRFTDCQEFRALKRGPNYR